MKTYFVTSDNVENLQTALGCMIEYAKYLESEFGREKIISFVDEILIDNEISFNIEEH